MDTEVEDKNLTEHFPDGSVRIYPQLDFWLFLSEYTKYMYALPLRPKIIFKKRNFTTLIFLIKFDMVVGLIGSQCGSLIFPLLFYLRGTNLLEYELKEELFDSNIV